MAEALGDIKACSERAPVPAGWSWHWHSNMSFCLYRGAQVREPIELSQTLMRGCVLTLHWKKCTCRNPSAKLWPHTGVLHPEGHPEGRPDGKGIETED